MFVINMDRPTRQITIHHANCPEYVTWAGVKVQNDGGWLGPYEVREEASARASYEARQLTSANISGPPCRRCPPLEQADVLLMTSILHQALEKVGGKLRDQYHNQRL